MVAVDAQVRPTCAEAMTSIHPSKDDHILCVQQNHSVPVTNFEHI